LGVLLAALRLALPQHHPSNDELDLAAVNGVAGLLFTLIVIGLNLTPQYDHKNRMDRGTAVLSGVPTRSGHASGPTPMTTGRPAC
jgi:hypothetical protein